MKNNRYEELKKEAASIVPILGMGKAMAKIGMRSSALDYYKKAYSKAVKVVEQYGDLGEAYIVYSSASSPLFRFYADHGMMIDALQACAADFKYLRPLHRQFNIERPCTLLLTTAQQTVVALSEYLKSEKGESFMIEIESYAKIMQTSIYIYELEEEKRLFASLLRQAYNFLYLVFNEMKNIEPDNVLIKTSAPLVQSQEGFGILGLCDILWTIDSSKIGEIMDDLAQNLIKIK